MVLYLIVMFMHTNATYAIIFLSICIIMFHHRIQYSQCGYPFSTNPPRCMLQLEMIEKTLKISLQHRNYDEEYVEVDSMWLYNRYWLPVEESSTST
ncbi:hypothetical protein IEQ34_002003 [Dendrobium chrysotoxum]|uniref:Uncharacterized protein n=1 Tax=Dendrobium chrysotoxum TaxID=161865 RepID=A0AAV7HJK9_DENCH|nr:hypothetical protein IEQ34_002003 [Dendrobium chrysotoxum]